MKKNRSAGFAGNILKIITVIPALFSLTSNLLSQVHDEAAKMRKHFFALIILSILFFVILLTIWFSLNGLLIMYFLSLNVSLMLSLTMVFVLNFLLLVIVSLAMLQLKVDPTFPETREVIKELIHH